MNNIKKKFISILITNFNKERFLKKSLNSCINQTYKSKEIIVFDDNSKDKSLEIIKKYKTVKLIKNKKKKYFSGPLNQIYGLSRIFKKSKGEIIFLLDSDDEFKKDKLLEIFKIFNKNNKLNFIQDTPVFKNSKKKMKLKKKLFLFTIWPSFHPTSCIAVKRNFLKQFFKYAEEKKFPNLEIDARICIFAFLKREFIVTNKSLTFYNFDQHGITSKYKKFSLLWWKKRSEAFEYTKFLTKKMNKKFFKGPDYYITKLVNLFF